MYMQFQGLATACEKLRLQAPTPPARSSFLYTNFCGELRSKLVARSVEVAAVWVRLHHCNVATLLWSLFRSNDAVKYIKEHLCDPNVLSRDPTCPLDAELRDLLQSRLLPQMRDYCASNLSAASCSPALNQLRQILAEQFQRQPDSRALVFVQQRCFTGVVKSFLVSKAVELSTAGVQIGVITGANASGDSGGITQTSQSELLSQFRNGKVQILISTSVTEEASTCKSATLLSVSVT
ncbi:hypothetical protein BOX15_Mlig002702g1 [Macrostomum lignano]|uniref:Helicase C-terminal domain-containing protein n=1 Tax=Macrostomum lignano TaxID=282301 RepID=A0A267EH80_9PLAT|nr:hypothetical protein BOX15_Mlig002702g1 [Macrostomum lignano]